MTIETKHTIIHYQGNNTAVCFPITFDYHEPSHIHVARFTIGGDWEWLTPEQDYHVDHPARTNTRQVTLKEILRHDQSIAIIRLLQPLQLTDLRNQGQFYAETHEDAFDYLTALIQQLDYWVGSSPDSQTRILRLKGCDPVDSSGRWDAKDRRIVSLQDPQNPDDAANKRYTDQQDNRLKQYIDDKLIQSGGCDCPKPLSDTVLYVYGEKADYSSLHQAFEKLKGRSIGAGNSVTLKIPKGIFRETEGIIHTSPQEGLNIQGEKVSVTVTGVRDVQSTNYTVSVQDNWKTGTKIPYHKVEFNLKSTSGLSIGEFLLIRDTVKTKDWPLFSGDPDDSAAVGSYRVRWANFTENKIPLYAACGAHEIIGIDNENKTVTVLLYNRVAPPKGAWTQSVSAAVIQSVIHYDTSNALKQGISAFKLFSGGYLGVIDNVALVGRGRPYYTDIDGTVLETVPDFSGYELKDIPPGCLRGPYDYQESENYYGFLAYQNTKFTFGLNAVVTGFCANNILTNGSGLFQGFLSNSWGQNIGIGSGGSVRLVDCVSHGGWLDAVAVQDGGELTCQRCCFVGNARSGIIFSQGCTTGANSYITAVYNGCRGGDVEDKETGKEIGYTAGGNAAGIVVYGDASCIQSLVAFNQWHGILASAAAKADLRNSHVFNNRKHGVWVLNGAAAVFRDSSFYNNGLDTDKDTVYYDIVVRNNATVTMANDCWLDSETAPLCSPVPNAFGRTGGFISAAIPMVFKDEEGTTLYETNTQYITSISSASADNSTRDLTVWNDGRVTIGQVEFPGSYSSLNDGIELEVRGGIAGSNLMPYKGLDTTGKNPAANHHIGSKDNPWKTLYCDYLNYGTAGTHTEKDDKGNDIEVPNNRIGSSSFPWEAVYANNFYGKDAAATTSDWRAKDQIEVSPLGLSFINRLIPVKYKWLDYAEVQRRYEPRLIQGEDGQWYEKLEYAGDETVNHTFVRPHYGLIAQQLKTAFEAEGESDCAAYIKGDNDYEGIRYSELIAPLIRAVQELSARIEALEANANITPASYQLPVIPEYRLEKRTVVEHPIEETMRLLGESHTPQAIEADHSHDDCLNAPD